MIRRWRWWLLLALLAPTVAQASIPSAIENVLKSWFNSAGHFIGFRMYGRSAPAVSVSGSAVFYYDTASGCLKVSSNGGAFSCIAGTGNSTSGCTFTSGTLVCPAFDSPADPVNGSCVTVKEGSNNGVNTVQGCAPPALSTNRINLFNVDGTHKSNNVETPNAPELGRMVRFGLTDGILGAKVVASPMFLPDGAAGSPAVTTVTEVQGGANAMRCVRFAARDTIINATAMSVEVVGNAGSCNACLYNDTDAAGSLVAPLTAGVASTTLDCSTAGAKTKSAVDAFTLLEGQGYRLCWTSSSTSTTLRGGLARVTGIANVTSVTAGTAAQSGSTGVCPSFTGAISAATVIPPIVSLGP